jgi:hypothetical protein
VGEFAAKAAYCGQDAATMSLWACGISHVFHSYLVLFACRVIGLSELMNSSWSRREGRQSISKRTTAEKCFGFGYQNIPVNLDEALRQIGRYLYGVQHHERAQRVTHSLEALDEGSGTEVREHKDADEWPVAIRALFIK